MRVHVSVRGEGPNDYGRWDALRGRLAQEGCYLAFLRRACEEESKTPRADFHCVQADRFPKKLPGGKALKKVPALNGFEPHVFYSTLEAMQVGANLLVIGADTEEGLEGMKSRLPEACRQRYAQFQTGHQKAIAFEPAAATVRLVVLVPLVKLESWLLADEEGFRLGAAFHRGPLPKNPEQLYGMTDAKEHLEKLFHAHRKPSPQTAEKARLAFHVRPDVLQRECPVSYPPFLTSVDSFVLDIG